MKLTKLLENEDDNIGQLKLKYPMIEATLTCSYFITDLPVNISEKQLQQLCKISFVPDIFRTLYPIYNSVCGRLRIIVVREIDMKIKYDKNLDKKFGSGNRDKWCTTWKEFVEMINREYSFVLNNTNDFEN